MKTKLTILILLSVLYTESYSQTFFEFNYQVGKDDFEKRKFISSYNLFAGYGKPELKIESKQGIEGFDKTEKYSFYGGGSVVIRNVTVGIEYSEISFDLTPPPVLADHGIDTSTSNVKIRYISIPVIYEFLSIIIQNTLRINLGIGPSFGFRLSSNEESGLGIKNFNFGLNSKLYAQLPVSSAADIFGGIQYEYGGFNNLGETLYVSKVNFSVLRFFGGVRVSL